jgi:hypothetical protein
MKYATLSLAVLMLIGATGPQSLSSSVQGIRFGEPAFAPGIHKVIVPGGDTRIITRARNAVQAYSAEVTALDSFEPRNHAG